jgi:8-oxo-dGTP pyrophosphatase MutT (NUDIX family)
MPEPCSPQDRLDRDAAVVPAAVPAATVVVVRDGERELEAYLQRRPRTMGFAGGLWVFPGGRVEEDDRDAAIDEHWAGPPPSAWARRLGLGVADARGLVVAACREAFEEAGLLLADRAADPDVPAAADPQARVAADSQAPVADPQACVAADPRAVAVARRELLEGERSFVAVLADLGVRLDTSRLRYWAWWVTPEGEPRRYDTRFFVAELPHQTAVSARGVAEVDRERWLPPREAAADQSMLMLPPTRYTLRDLAGFRTVGDVLSAAASRPVERIMPRLEGDVLVMPWNEHYPVPVPPADSG